MNQGKAINLSEVQRAELERWVRSQTQDSRSVRRARIVLFFLSQDFDKKKNRCSAGPNWAQNTSASCRACLLPADCTGRAGA